MFFVQISDSKKLDCFIFNFFKYMKQSSCLSQVWYNFVSDNPIVRILDVVWNPNRLGMGHISVCRNPNAFGFRCATVVLHWAHFQNHSWSCLLCRKPTSTLSRPSFVCPTVPLTCQPRARWSLISRGPGTDSWDARRVSRSGCWPSSWDLSVWNIWPRSSSTRLTSTKPGPPERRRCLAHRYDQRTSDVRPKNLVQRGS